MSKLIIHRILVLTFAFTWGTLRADAPGLAAEKLVGLQSAPSIAMAVPWFAEEARLYPKYDLDFQLVYIASSGIVTAAMSGGNGSVAIVGGEGPIRAYLSGNTDFVFIGSVKNVLTHSIMGKPEIKKPEDLKGKKVGVGRIGGNSHYFAQYGMRQKGMDLATISLLLRSSGWKDREIADAFAERELAMPLPERAGVGSARDAFCICLRLRPSTPGRSV